MKYFVRVEDEEVEITIDGPRVAIDGEAFHAHLEDAISAPTQIVTIGSDVHRVLARRTDVRGRYDISVDGFRFRIEALDERSRAIRDLSSASARPTGPTHLSAPMPGLIVRINVVEGDQVRAGQGLVVMEAMKMENELRSAVAGVVRKILVSAGNAVEKGALLLEME
jgi:biotin carboxyl carrier protein